MGNAEYMGPSSQAPPHSHPTAPHQRPPPLTLESKKPLLDYKDPKNSGGPKVSFSDTKKLTSRDMTISPPLPLPLPPTTLILPEPTTPSSPHLTLPLPHMLPLEVPRSPLMSSSTTSS